MPLTPKQQRFVDEYLVDLNATQAAIRAGYSANTARQIGQENLSKPDIAAAVQARSAARQARTEVTQDTVVQGLLAEARSVGEDTSQAARVKAWELLGKHVGMFEEKHRHEHTGPDGKPIQHEHAGRLAITARLDQLAAAFAGAAAREEAGAVPGDGAGEPVGP